MTLLQILPVLAYAGIVIVVLAAAMEFRLSPALRWLVPATTGLLFTLFSLVTVWQEGIIQFWINHSTNLAGNQVWFDLLLAVGIAFILMAPRARAVGMPLIPWAIFVLATASIGLLPMLARLFWLEHHMNQRSASR
ncbi:MAG: hypothetical protein CTY25_04775 [Methylobacterium sp.]|nr:MAG: hypothetical protein CTY25_04775 [Methylobacterium sp.]